MRLPLKDMGTEPGRVPIHSRGGGSNAESSKARTSCGKNLFDRSREKRETRSRWESLIVSFKMMRVWLLICFTLASCVSAWSSPTSKVLVHIPFQIHNASGFDHVRAEFGFSTESAGRSLAEYVYFVDEPLCRPLTNFTAAYPAHNDTRKTPFILMVDDNGGCSAVTKARHAQQLGASALLISDIHCRCSDTACTQRFRNDTCLDTDPVLVDDGSGRDISIPSFMIFKSLGVNLREQLRKGQPCLVELQWGLQENDIDHAQPWFNFWTTAYDPLVSLEYYVHLRTLVTAFDGVINFAPHYSVIDGRRFQCNTEPDANAPCDHLCSNHGRYCTLHATDLSGHAIVKETLRRLCIWKHFGESDHNTFWDYVIYHKEYCGSSPHNFADPDCVDAALKTAKIDRDTVSHCMSDSGDMDEDLANTLLDDALTHQRRSGVVSLPALSVNHKVLPSNSPHALFSTICTEYWLSGIDKIPKICETCGTCPNTIGCMEKGHCVDFTNDERHPETGFGKKKKKKRRGWKITLWLFGTAAMALGAWYYYDKHYRGGGQWGSQSRAVMMQNYMQLSGEE